MGISNYNFSRELPRKLLASSPGHSQVFNVVHSFIKLGVAWDEANKLFLTHTCTWEES